MKLNRTDEQKLLPILDQLARAVEELLLSGLTTASETTRQILGVAFQEASRQRLLRLGSTLRIVLEELARFNQNEPEFSRKRLCFFLTRAWLMSRGLAHAVRAGDAQEYERLVWTPASEPVARLEVVTLGVVKKVAVNAFYAFEFRLRTVQPAGRLPAGQRLVWSCVFPVKRDVEIPPEGFLHLPQKQKFTAFDFLKGKTLIVERAAVTLDEYGGRISLGEQSTVTQGDLFQDWTRFHSWDAGAALQRLRNHQPGPLDLDVEMQEEVVLKDWQVGDPIDGELEGQTIYPIACGPVTLDAVVASGKEGTAVRQGLESQRKSKRRPPLFGLMHYEKCRLRLQPLSVLGPTGPEHLMIADEKVDRAALLKALKF
jgi:hypothetical protein